MGQAVNPKPILQFNLFNDENAETFVKNALA